MTITHLAFDLGGVLFEWSPRNLYRNLIADEAELGEFMDRVFSKENIYRVDGFSTIHAGMADLARRYPDDAYLIEQYIPRWRETMGPVYIGVVGILEDLNRAGLPCYALSNWAKEIWHHGEAHLDFLELFDGLFISGIEGVAKPDPDFFTGAAQRFGLVAETTFFVDDNMPNVEAAATLGFQAVLFENAQKLRADLAAAGVVL